MIHSILVSMYSYPVGGGCYKRNDVIPDLGFVSGYNGVDMVIHQVLHLITIALSNQKELASLKYLSISIEAITMHIHSLLLAVTRLQRLVDGLESWVRFSNRYLKWCNTAQYQVIMLFLVSRWANRSVVWFQKSRDRWNEFHGSSYLSSQYKEKASRVQPALLQPLACQILFQPRVSPLRNSLAVPKPKKFGMDAKEEGTHWRGWHWWFWQNFLSQQKGAGYLSLWVITLTHCFAWVYFY